MQAQAEADSANAALFPEDPKPRGRGRRADHSVNGQVFAKRLRAIRLQRGLTQEQLSKLARLGGGQVAGYENPDGRRTPTVSVLVRLADALNVTTDWLCGRDSLPDDQVPPKPLPPRKEIQRKRGTVTAAPAESMPPGQPGPAVSGTAAPSVAGVQPPAQL